MTKEGKTIYFVPSLHENAVKCIVLSVTETNANLKDRHWIIAQAKNGVIYSDYASKFSATKPNKYVI